MQPLYVRVKITIKSVKHNRQTSGELLSNERRAVGFVGSQPRLIDLWALHLYPVSENESQIGRTNRPGEELLKREQDSYICYILLLRAINTDFLKSAC